ncbi:DUF924 family protein [Litorilituus lipolyticus]|uniref:DUF924 domain-containing protein n=1 Tax=Litorilituus lipolyticus TaxID=2491017 RepID=A0A502KXT1_9GAMM|nr:DUF924 family protein [Litorilituus lipolyticus]TPH16590.1 DUF924 domain-containing protein [Litorilituus lipolyticus]
MTAHDVIHFWFEEVSQENWWIKDNAFDKEITERFLTLHQQAIQGELFAWRDSALGCLAEIIILDQFSRNIYRDLPQAFSADSMALTLAQQAISSSKDKELNTTQRAFLYMPFMHSESLLIHDVAVKLFTDLGVSSNLAFEIKHRDIIAQFGRYPHRNIILNRQSSAEEIEFLQQPGSSF